MPKPRAYAMTHALGYVLDVITPEEHARSEGKYTLALYDQAAIDEAVKEERERCAKLVEAMDTTGHDGYIETTGDLCEAIAERIRRG